MKNFPLVAVLLIVFTVTSFRVLAQPKRDFFKDRNGLEFTSKYATYNATPNYNALNSASGSTLLLETESCTPLQFKYAQLIDSDIESISNTVLYDFVDKWWGVRYRYGGTTMRGVDCSSYTGQLISAVYGINLPRTAREQYKVVTRVNRMDLEEGDLVFFNTRGGVSHVGVYLGNNYFTHSGSSSGVTISSLDDAYYSRKYIGGGRIDKVTLSNYTEPSQTEPEETEE
jgi:cell wall-associated NlpC family hydrolase